MTKHLAKNPEDMLLQKHGVTIGGIVEVSKKGTEVIEIPQLSTKGKIMDKQNSMNEEIIITNGEEKIEDTPADKNGTVRCMPLIPNAYQSNYETYLNDIMPYESESSIKKNMSRVVKKSTSSWYGAYTFLGAVLIWIGVWTVIGPHKIIGDRLDEGYFYKDEPEDWLIFLIVHGVISTICGIFILPDVGKHIPIFPSVYPSSGPKHDKHVGFIMVLVGYIIQWLAISYPRCCFNTRGNPFNWKNPDYCVISVSICAYVLGSVINIVGVIISYILNKQ